jgi:hypothetical protein
MVAIRISRRPPDRRVSRYFRNGGAAADGSPSDMQMVSLTLRVMSRPDMNVLPKIYQNLGLE